MNAALELFSLKQGLMRPVLASNSFCLFSQGWPLPPLSTWLRLQALTSVPRVLVFFPRADTEPRALSMLGKRSP